MARRAALAPAPPAAQDELNGGEVSLRDQLIAAIHSWDLGLSGDLGDDVSLIRSGIFDSVALFNLVLWVEQQIGRPVDPTSFDLAEEWDTVGGVLRFIEQRRSRA